VVTLDAVNRACARDVSFARRVRRVVEDDWAELRVLRERQNFGHL